MLVSPLPSCPPQPPAPYLASNPLFYSTRTPGVLGRPWRSIAVQTLYSPIGPEKKDDCSAADLSIDHLAVDIKPFRNANALPQAGRSHTASQQIPRLKCGRGAATSRSIFWFKTRAGFVESLRTYCASSTRPAWRYHISPESGIEVSTAVKALSREKRKMWLTFWYHVYL
jgi:hypothetical protein